VQYGRLRRQLRKKIYRFLQHVFLTQIGVPYFRFNPQMSVDLAMDEKMDAPLINMMWETKAYMYQNRNKVIEMVNMLK
jgi:hypothetical protein